MSVVQLSPRDIHGKVISSQQCLGLGSVEDANSNWTMAVMSAAAAASAIKAAHG